MEEGGEKIDKGGGNFNGKEKENQAKKIKSQRKREETPINWKRK